MILYLGYCEWCCNKKKFRYLFKILVSYSLNIYMCMWTHMCMYMKLYYSATVHSHTHIIWFLDHTVLSWLFCLNYFAGFIFIILRNLNNVVLSSCCNLHFHQQYVKVLFSPYPHHHLLLLLLLLFKDNLSQWSKVIFHCGFYLGLPTE